MTVSPALIVTVLSSVAGFSNSKSMTRMVPGARSGAPWASAGIAIAAAAIAIHGRCLSEWSRPRGFVPRGPRSRITATWWTA